MSKFNNNNVSNEFVKINSNSKEITFKFVSTDDSMIPNEVTLRVGENGLTEDILREYCLEHNRLVDETIKATDTTYTRSKKEKEANKKEKEEWVKNYIVDFISDNGYSPNKEDVEDEWKKHNQGKYVTSWDGLLESWEESGGIDKSPYVAQTATYDKYFDPANYMRELISKLPRNLQIVYHEGLINEESNVSIAKKLGVSETTIRKWKKEIMDYLKNSEELKNFYEN